MNAEQFTTWLRGYMAAMHGRLGTPADVETIRAELAKVAAPPVLNAPFPAQLKDPAFITDALKRAADEVEKRKNAETPIGPQNPKWASSGCAVCGMGANGAPVGYVCSRGDCPTRSTCGTARTETAYVGPSTARGSSIK